jgi:hypothetical protein
MRRARARRDTRCCVLTSTRDARARRIAQSREITREFFRVVENIDNIRVSRTSSGDRSRSPRAVFAARMRKKWRRHGPLSMPSGLCKNLRWGDTQIRSESSNPTRIARIAPKCPQVIRCAHVQRARRDVASRGVSEVDERRRNAQAKRERASTTQLANPVAVLRVRSRACA